MPRTSKGRRQVAAAIKSKAKSTKKANTKEKEEEEEVTSSENEKISTTNESSTQEMDVEEPQTPELPPEEPPKEPPKASSERKGSLSRRKSSSGVLPPLQEAPAADYLSEGMGHMELVRRLRRLHEYLMNVGQDEGTGQLGGIAAALASPAYTSHRDKDVRLLCACCLVDIIRIYAPDAPYEAGQLASIFALFLEQIKGVGDPAGANFALHYYLLERLSLVKAFVILLDVSAELVEDLFAQAFAQVGSDELPQNCVALYADVLQTCIAESDRLPAGALEALLLPLTYPHKKEAPRACAFSKLLVKACWERVRDEVTALYRDDGGASEDSELRGKVHELIFELNKVEPRTLSGVLPLLEGELRVDSDELRTLSVQLLSRMFAARGSELHAQYPQLFAAFLARFGDKLPGVRCVMLEFAKYFMLRNAAPRAEADKNAPAALAERIGLGKELLLRLRDLDEAVRVQAVATACDVAREFPGVVEEAVIDEVLERLKDRKAEVRAETMRRVADLYVFMTYRARPEYEGMTTEDIEAIADGKHGIDNEEIDFEEDEDRYGKMQAWWPRYASIPSRVLCCYMLGIEEDKLRVDSTLTDLVWRTAALTVEQREAVEKLGADGEDKKKGGRRRSKKASDADFDEGEVLAALARAFVRILRGLDAKARAAFGLLLREKRALQQDFAAFLEAGAKGAKTPALVRLTERLAVQGAPGAPLDRAKEAARHLLDTREGKASCDSLRAVCAADSPLAAYAAHRRIWGLERAGPSDVVHGLAARLFLGLVANGVIARALVDDLSESKHDAEAFFEVLVLYSRLCPAEMGALAEEIFALLDARHFRSSTAAADSVLAVLATEATRGLAAKQPRAASAIRQRLMEYAQTGTPHQAKLAVRVMARMSGKASDALAREFDPLLRLLAEGAVNMDSSHLPTALQSLTRIAQLVRNAGLIEKTVAPVLVFVTDTLLSRKPEDEGARERANDRTRRVQAQEYGIKFLTYYLLTLREPNVTKSAPIIDLLFKLAGKPSTPHTNEEDDEDNEDGMEIEPEVRKAAECGLINLARVKSYERLITPELLQRIAEFALDNDPTVRAGFEQKLAKYLIAVQLPLRYLAALAFFACEPRRDLFSAVRLHIQQSVSARREYVKRMQAANAASQQSQSQSQPTGGPAENIRQNLSLMLPEYSLPYLVSLLAHTERFDSDNYAFAARALWLLLGALMHGSSDYMFLEEIVHFIGVTEDARTPPMSENVHTASKIALGMIRKSAESRAWRDKGAHPGEVFLPPAFFKIVSDKARLRELAKKMNDTSLPSGLVLPDIINESFSRGSIAPPLSSASASVSTSMSTTGTSLSAATTPSKRKKKGRGQASPVHKKASKSNAGKRRAKKDSDDDDDDESDESDGSDDESYGSGTSAPPETPTRVLPRRNAKRRISYSEGTD